MHILLQSTILNMLKDWDQWLFMVINSKMTNPFFDSLMPFLRNSLNWAPLYLFLIVLAAHNFKMKGWWWVLFLLVTVSMTDMIGARIIKAGFERLRPCSDPDFWSNVRLLVDHCSGGFSFTSNHAANHFGVAGFFYFTFRPVFRHAWIAFLWAGAISYAQIYVGVHYPGDVLGGTLLGLAVGTFTARLFNKRFGFAIFDKQPTLSS
jgi:membrane-associated phospholipid phosphatase